MLERVVDILVCIDSKTEGFVAAPPTDHQSHVVKLCTSVRAKVHKPNFLPISMIKRRESFSPGISNFSQNQAATPAKNDQRQPRLL